MSDTLRLTIAWDEPNEEGWIVARVRKGVRHLSGLPGQAGALETVSDTSGPSRRSAVRGV